jgi:hypothetical protein
VAVNARRLTAQPPATVNRLQTYVSSAELLTVRVERPK